MTETTVQIEADYFTADLLFQLCLSGVVLNSASYLCHNYTVTSNFSYYNVFE